jgi:hypothetical protein
VFRPTVGWPEAMSCNRKGASTIIATILTVFFAVVGSAVYYFAATSYMRHQAGFSPDVEISVGGVGVHCHRRPGGQPGGIPLTFRFISVIGGSSHLQVTYSSSMSADGGAAIIIARRALGTSPRGCIVKNRSLGRSCCRSGFHLSHGSRWDHD